MKAQATVAIVAMLVVCTHVHADILFQDDFDDGIVDPRYTAIGGASILESAGSMFLEMFDTGDGLNIFLEDVATEDYKCFFFDYEPNGWELGEIMKVDVYVPDLLGGELLGFQLTIEQIDSVKVKAQPFDADGNPLPMEMFILEGVDHAGNWSFRLDIVDRKWVWEGGVNVGQDDEVVARLTNDVWASIANDRGVSSVRITSASDGVIAMNSLVVADTHIPQPASVSLLAIGALLVRRRRR